MLKLSEEQCALVDEARAFVSREITPVAARFDASGEFPSEIIGRAHKLGLVNLIQKAEAGGTGLSLFDACLIIEEISAGCAGFATSMVANDLALTPIMLGGSADQHNRFLKPLCTSGKIASFCLTEPGAGSDVAGMSTTVRKEGGEYIINGAKQWITNGGVASQ